MSLNKDWEYSNNYRGRLGAAKVHGICMTTACHWAKNTSNSGKMLAQRITVSPIAASAMHVVHTRNVDTIQAGGGSFRSRVDKWHKGFFDNMNMPGRCASVQNGGNHDITSSKGVYVISIYGSGGGHTMAFARFSSRSVFFDPNYGQFSCRASALSSFKSNVRRHITDRYPGLQSGSYVYRIG